MRSTRAEDLWGGGAAAAAADEEDEEGGREYWETESEAAFGEEEEEDRDLADCRSARGDRPTTEGAAAGRWGAATCSMFAGSCYS